MVSSLAGSGEVLLLMCCGLPPAGSVCLGHMAAALEATTAGGPRLEASPVSPLPLQAADSLKHATVGLGPPARSPSCGALTDATKLVQHRPRMLTVKAAGGAEHDAYLALSFESAGYTTLLDIRGTSFQEASPPGLALDASTLLLARLPDGRLLQVTPQVLTLPGAPFGPSHIISALHWTSIDARKQPQRESPMQPLTPKR